MILHWLNRKHLEAKLARQVAERKPAGQEYAKRRKAALKGVAKRRGRIGLPDCIVVNTRGEAIPCRPGEAGGKVSDTDRMGGTLAAMQAGVVE